jgi:glycosyltransferase involved in cell wall biosynthesis
MSGLRLLLVTDAVGGVWTYSLELAHALRPFGIETVLAVMGPSPTEAQRQEAAPFELIDTRLPLEWLDVEASDIRRAGREIAEIANRTGADIVQIASAALLADVKFDQPCVAVQHSCLASWWEAVRGTPLPVEFRWRRDLVQRGLERASAIIAPSLAFAADTSRIYGVSAIAVHNGRTAATHGRIPQGQFVFTAGRLWDEGKNVATLDRAAANIDLPFQAAGPKHGPNGAHVWIEHLQALGELDETKLAGLYAARPIYASAALYEPFGLAVLEAAQAGCALVLSDIPTHREMWEGAAIFLPPPDESAFAARIESLIRDPDQRRQLGERARARASLYTPERMARGMADIYARVTSRAVAPLMAGAA